MEILFNADTTRNKKIQGVIARELAEGAEVIEVVRRGAEHLLRAKGYGADEIHRNVSFEVQLGAETATSSMDFVIALEGASTMAIKCAAGSPGSRERQVLAAARIMEDRPIPIAVVMDPETAIVLTVDNGVVLAEGFPAIPNRAELANLAAGRTMPTLDARQRERERRILLAFDAIQCCIPQGADGGVELCEAPKTPDGCSCGSTRQE